MQVIRPGVPLAESILGKTPLRQGQMCRLLTYLVRAEHADGTLLYNVMTKAVVLLTAEETALIDALPAVYTQAHQALAELWFIVQADNDDMALSDNLKGVVMALDSGSKPVTSYTIFTTTDCNARCFYCFEAGTRRYSMTEQTAHDVAAFIAAHHEGQPVSLHWFGGEPLFNSSVIDVICADLREAGVKYKSTMISNGYLFDETLVRKAAEDWKLQRVQITLDGTEANYNRRKAYVRPEGSPYQRVLRNIGLLSDGDIAVHIRLNTELANADDISALCDELHARFQGRKGILVYIAPIFEDTGARPVHYDDDGRARMNKIADELQRKLDTCGMHASSPLPYRLRTCMCMADNPVTVTVLPDGRLGRCNTFTDSETYGSIYSDERVAAKVTEWCETYPPVAACRMCFFYPECRRLKRCPNQTVECDDDERKYLLPKQQESLLSTYQRYLQKHPPEADDSDLKEDC